MENNYCSHSFPWSSASTSGLALGSEPPIPSPEPPRPHEWRAHGLPITTRPKRLPEPPRAAPLVGEVKIDGRSGDDNGGVEGGGAAQ